MDRTLSRVDLSYKWVGKYDAVRKYVREYNISKNVCREPVTIQGSLIATTLLELVFLDVMTLDKDTDGRKNVLVMTDEYTKFVKAVSTPNQSAEMVTTVSIKDWIYNVGTPTTIHRE